MLSNRVKGLLLQIRNAILQLQEWNKDVISPNDYYSSPEGMKNLTASCMLIEAIGEGIKQIDKITNSELLTERSEIPWQDVIGIRNHIAHDCESVNAQSTRELYEEALAKHPDASCIYIISDNARYYHNKELAEWVKGTKIKQIFLPPYSPNLNLIERLWRFLRKKVINTGFYRTKEEFRRAIAAFFANIKKYKEELESLLTFNFRLVNSQTISF